MTDKLSEITKQLTIYLFDLNSLITSLNSNIYNRPKFQIISENEKKLNTFSDELNEEQTFDNKIKNLKIIQEILDYIFSELKNIKCADKFLNEKTDLIVRTYSLREQTENLLSINKTNSTEH